jgi:hypothetical protein
MWFSGIRVQRTMSPMCTVAKSKCRPIADVDNEAEKIGKINFQKAIAPLSQLPFLQAHRYQFQRSPAKRRTRVQWHYQVCSKW